MSASEGFHRSVKSLQACCFSGILSIAHPIALIFFQLFSLVIASDGIEKFFVDVFRWLFRGICGSGGWHEGWVENGSMDKPLSLFKYEPDGVINVLDGCALVIKCNGCSVRCGFDFLDGYCGGSVSEKLCGVGEGKHVLEKGYGCLLGLFAGVGDCIVKLVFAHGLAVAIGYFLDVFLHAGLTCGQRETCQDNDEFASFHDSI